MLSAALAVAPLVLGACPPSSDTNNPAARTAALFVTLDTLGDRGAADTLMACAEDSTDTEIAPTTRVTVGAPGRAPVGDSTEVVVLYQVLGDAHPEDAGTAGPLYWRFTSHPRVDTARLHIAADADGRQWIGCGDFEPNHPMMSELTQAMKLLDSLSQHELELAKAGKPSTRKPEPKPAPAPASPAVPAAAPAPPAAPADSK